MDKESTDSDSGDDFSFLKSENNLFKRGEILLVDDDEDLRLNIRDALELNNYSVSTANNGLEAVEIVKHKNFDIILMDINMPEMGGIEAVEKIKSFNPKAFIIMMTGATDEEIRSSLEEGGYACIRKPITIKKLLKSLEWHKLAADDIKRKYKMAEQYEKLPESTKASLRLRRYIKAKISANKWGLMILISSVMAIIIGVLMLLFIETAGDSIGKKMSKFDRVVDQMDKVIGFLKRDEQRELK